MCHAWENQANKVWGGYFQMKLKSMTAVEIKSLLQILRLDIQWRPWSEAIFRDIDTDWTVFWENFSMTCLDIDSKDCVY